jgi:hypothetical protein
VAGNHRPFAFQFLENDRVVHEASKEIEITPDLDLVSTEAGLAVNINPFGSRRRSTPRYFY